MIGQRGCGSVYRAELKKPRLGENGLTSIVVVTSADPLKDHSLLWEKKVLDALQGCPYFLQTFGADTTKTRDGDVLYNVLLEFALGGSLIDLIENSGGNGLCESDVRKYTESILIGLKHIHASGTFMPDNVLLVPKADGFEVWDTKSGSKEFEDLMSQIGSDLVPYIPKKISAVAEDFLMCGFAINPLDRITADAMLEHPFVAELDEKDSHVQVSEEAANAKRKWFRLKHQKEAETANAVT